MLWAGNVDGVIAYLSKVGDGELKAGGRRELEGTVAYLEKARQDPLLRRQGAPGPAQQLERGRARQRRHRREEVEGEGLSWCDDGSFALEALTAVFLNGARRTSSSGRPSRCADAEADRGLGWVIDEDVRLAVTSCTGWAEERGTVGVVGDYESQLIHTWLTWY